MDKGFEALKVLVSTGRTIVSKLHKMHQKLWGFSNTSHEQNTIQNKHVIV